MSSKAALARIAEEDPVVVRKFDFRSEEEAGASLSHNQINRNFCGILWTTLRDKCCQPFASDMPVYSAIKKRVYLPDIVVVCNDPLVEPCEIEIKDKESGEVKRSIRKALTNPSLIGEVWSDGNSSGEKEEKLTNYKQIESLRHYLTIEQIKHEIHYYCRGDDGTWSCKKIDNDDDEISIAFAEFTVSFFMKEIYEKVI